MSRRHLVMLFALAAIWGSSFMLIEIALRDLDPASLIAGRIAFASIALAAVATLRMRAADVLAELRRAGWPLAALGLLNTAVPFFLIAWGQQYVDSGVAAILNASAPLFTVLLGLASARAGESIAGLRLAGFALGFAGVVAVAGGHPDGGPHALTGSVAVVVASACYAVGALYAGRKLVTASPLIVSLGSMLWATAFPLPPGLLRLSGREVGPEAAASVVLLGVVATGLAYLLYFGLIAGAGASRAILVTYLVPSLALFYGVTLLGEPLTAAALAGLVLVLAGVALGTGAVGKRARPAPARE